MKIVLLDALTLGDSDLGELQTLGELTIYQTTLAEQRLAHILGHDVVVTNKVVISEEVMAANPQLKLICVTATGTNNIDLVAAEKRGIIVKNVIIVT
jgi:glycerate dehydrogenase